MREQLFKWIEQRRSDWANIGIVTSKVYMGGDDSPKPSGLSNMNLRIEVF